MKTYFDDFSESYKLTLAQSIGGTVESAIFFASQKVKHLKRFKPQDNPATTLLDYGCGVGMSIGPLRKQFCDTIIIGSDPSQSSLDIASNEHKSDTLTHFIPLEDLNKSCYLNYFNIIFVSCVFHHIEEIDQVPTLKYLRQLCAPSGLLVIFEHNPINPITRNIVSNCPFDEGVTLISPQTLGYRLRSAGWHNLRKRYISFVPPKFKSLIALESKLYWLPFGSQYFITAEPRQS